MYETFQYQLNIDIGHNKIHFFKHHGINLFIKMTVTTLDKIDETHLLYIYFK